MTTIFPEEVRCPECGHQHTVHVLVSDNTFANEEPYFVYRGYARCPWCGHHDEKEGVIEFLSDDPEERFLQLAPNIEPGPERDLPPPGTTQVTFGKWISPKKRG